MIGVWKSEVTFFMKLLFFKAHCCLQRVKSKLSNVKFELMNKKVIISYDLKGDSDEEYLIECYLRKENADNFSHKLNIVSGRIGKGKFVGEKNEIIWDLYKEFPNGLVGDNFGG